MNEAVINTLKALRDVQGIEGSFVVGESGNLLAREMPAIFTDDLVCEATPRIARLAETFQSAAVDFETCVLRFADHLLYIRRLVKGSLCVLTRGDVNTPALKMAVNLAQRRLSTEMRNLTPEALLQARPIPATPSPAPAAGPARRVRMYRGQVVEE